MVHNAEAVSGPDCRWRRRFAGQAVGLLSVCGRRSGL